MSPRQSKLVYSPGFYKTNYRALRFGELARMRGRGFLDAFRAYFTVRYKKSSGGSWMPELLEDIECKKADLSEGFWRRTASYRQALAGLNFNESLFIKAGRVLYPNYRDAGSIIYVDQSRSHLGRVFYARFARPPTANDLEVVSVSFTAVFEHGSLTYTTAKDYFDSRPNRVVVRLVSTDTAFVYQRFLQHLKKNANVPCRFPDDDSLRKSFDVRQQEAFEDKARRGLYVRMSDEEVEVARKKLLDPVTEPLPPKFNSKSKWIVWPIFAAVIVALQLFKTHSSEREDTMEYRHESYKMRKAYASYEDYKDDPNNLATNELDRIEKAMVDAKIPPSFKNRDELIHTLIDDLQFPGYGESMGDQVKTDDGSTVEMDSVEIPQRSKERYVVVRESGGLLHVVDDFVFSTASNQITSVRLKGKKLHYYDEKGSLVRDKPL